ncbi:hypothetical protein SBOR_6587 [Sclerotinia borealis F-4128]|uniref:Uncharacterized protein n=1 Tax=Sclerotinia borealis (strain F-4128) TaxID=1432307 RepID=W9CAZ3_SCLBF|nr:hypothetical protein SBOR_6587 [Sclerotinia borealis F-4128]
MASPAQSPSTPAPNTQSVTQWLQKTGYPNGIPDFMHDYGFDSDEQDDALHLLHQFRNEQQAWEKTHHHRHEKPSPERVKTSSTVLGTSMLFRSSSSSDASHVSNNKRTGIAMLSFDEWHHEYSVSKKRTGTGTPTFKGDK